MATVSCLTGAFAEAAILFLFFWRGVEGGEGVTQGNRVGGNVSDLMRSSEICGNESCEADLLTPHRLDLIRMIIHSLLFCSN